MGGRTTPATMFQGLRIAVVSALAETRRAMRGYLEAVEAEVRTASTLADLAVVASGAAALVLFADDFPHGRVLTALAALVAAGGPGIVVVSEDVEMAKDARQVVAVPRPAWGWMVLDALRTLIFDEQRGEGRSKKR